ncbi:MAG: YggS family pyridoxal phosphate-dependent enzyme [Firmicutes bacterium]|nr:YggS family pyridoxal phosphate-dependent enzyme [Bacillota bacterium]
MVEIMKRLDLVREKVRKAAERVGREPDDISIVAVTKNVDTKDIIKAVRGGISILGENRAQEGRAKFSELGNNIEGKRIAWHFIGHLQRNKVRHVLRIFDFIHSLDSLRLAHEIERVSERLDITTECLLEINITGKPSRIGVEPEEALALARDISKLDRIKLRGVMSIAPVVEDPSQAKPYFRRTREICERITDAGLFRPGKIHLSMGMTNDFEAAIEEGATMVRIGTGIFGSHIRKAVQ